jgi:uncharacterized delta-60 repeat protein
MPRFALTLLSLLFALPPLQAQFNQPGQVDTTFNFGVPHSEFASAPSEIFGEGTVGTVSTVRQSSGKLVLGLKLPIGLYNGVETTTILRLKHNGYLDRTFNVGTGPLTAANMPSSISALAVQQDDKLLVAGDFTSLNGEPRFGLARLLPDGALDHTFDAGTGSLGSIEKILVHSDGTIYVAGNFSNFNGSGRKGIARLLPSGAVDNTFNAGNVPVADLWNVVLLDNGTVVLSGAFTNFNGHSKQHIVRLLADGSVDTGYNAGNLTSTPITNIAADGNRLMILETVSVIGTVMNRFLEDGTLDPAFRDVIVLGLGGMTEANGLCKIGSDWIVCGHLQNNSITMVKIKSDATVDPGFQFEFNGNFGDFYHVACYEGYGIALGISLIHNLFYTGNNGFTLLDTQTGKFANFNKRTGPALLDYYSGTTAIYDVKQSPEDGRLLIGGTFTHFNGEYTPSLCWLNIDGTVAIKNPGDHHADYVAKVHILNNGKVMAKGNFTEYSGVSVKDLIRLHADLTLDQTFQSELETNSSVDDFFVQPDNKILVLVNDTSLIRLNADGTRDYSFAGNIGQVTINSNSQHKTPLEIKADGSFLFAGSIKINNNWVPGLFSFEANGTLSKSVLQLNSGDISGIRLGVDGSILLYGYLLTVNNV